MKQLFILVFVFTSALFPQERGQKYWVYFTDKEMSAFSKSSAAAARSIGITDRAMQRRAKVHQEILTNEDLPVSQSYLDRLKSVGISIENRSRWFNAATAYLTSEQVKLLASFSFIKGIEPVRIFKRKELPKIESSLLKITEPHLGQKYSYGPSFAQMDMIKAVDVHNIGVSGRGVLVGMLDTGFRWKEHEAMLNMKVIGEYDFIQKDTSTANNGSDDPSQDSHGTSTMSLVGGFKEGQLVSPAFNAFFILGKTEYVPTETNVEEDNWVAAIEWMEANGVDVVNSSLGYSEFDAGQQDYTYNDMNGKTATTTKAATIAARKGVVVVNAMGNEAASAWHFLTSPADADSIISVGAVNGAGNYAGFSSVGPTSDNRTKPDVVAHGVGTYCAVPPGKVALYTGSSQGTSLATPLVAGVAAQVLSARPELTPVQVRDALRNSANNAASPNNTIGWGIINAYKAVLYNGMIISTDPEIALTIDSNYSIGMFVVSPNSVYKDSVKLFYSTNNGASFNSISMALGEIVDTATNSGKYSAVIPGVTSSTEVKFYAGAKDISAARTSPYNAPANLFSTKQTTTGVGTTPPFPTTFALKQNYPNPFNPATMITYDLPVSDVVSLKVYDILGKEVATLVNGFQQRRTYSVPFDGSHLASGVYFYRLQTTFFSQTKGMMLVK
ncbi:MAG: S8 family peptidase [Ignavibacteriales bacterium]|nr:S8 family peptidase [Ignavibacteriales bacterium]